MSNPIPEAPSTRGIPISSSPPPSPHQQLPRPSPPKSSSSREESRRGNPRETQYTVYIRLPFPRDGFIDPPRVDWDASKERYLWKILSKGNRDADINWDSLSQQLQVSRAFLLQQAAWLYERELIQIQAQMRKVGLSTSSIPALAASPSPTPLTPVFSAQQRTHSSLSASATTTPRATPVPHPRAPQQTTHRFSRPLASEEEKEAPEEEEDGSTVEESTSDSSSDGGEDADEAPQMPRLQTFRQKQQQQAAAAAPPNLGSEDERDVEDDDNEAAFLPFSSMVGASGGDMAGTVTLRSPVRNGLLRNSRAVGSAGLSSPSMGSSFSDLSDASVSQSAMEEAYLSTMQAGGGGGGVASRLGQVMKSRYFQS
ncbi:hypothetical protein FN846DRAFT_957006 [Sphaerosporella brunnea]|uniref:Autophagy-related protein 29 n=1 Tax=Sphaerosporella brunnea TaxID=1250544 RepID=A0A5J5ES17_9PEZI|nr:hypothetical protein FN846DRAFT_957006 [Sphaerosporella brunnea]